ncbi:MAG: hypothetical protein RLZZ217_785 [Planctomycetota bacterium]
MWMKQGRLFRAYVVLWIATGVLALIILLLPREGQCRWADSNRRPSGYESNALTS